MIEASGLAGCLGWVLIDSLTIAKPQVWLSITAYGKPPATSGWVLATTLLSARLLCWDERHFPAFVGDAIADPLTGVYAALAVIDAMAQGESGLLDFPMVAVAGRCRQKIARAGQAITCPLQETRTC